MAITTEGVLCYRLKEGGFDSISFLAFLEECLLPIYTRDKILIMDNAGIHHAHIIQQFFESNSITFKYMPPYSPMLNPIEEVFAFLKRKYSNIRPRPRNTAQLKETV